MYSVLLQLVYLPKCIFWILFAKNMLASRTNHNRRAACIFLGQFFLDVHCNLHWPWHVATTILNVCSSHGANCVSVWYLPGRIAQHCRKADAYTTFQRTKLTSSKCLQEGFGFWKNIFSKKQCIVRNGTCSS